MSATDAHRESPASLAVAVILLIIASNYVAVVSFSSMPWLAVLFGLVLLSVAWKLRHSMMVAVIYALYGASLVVLGIWVTIAKVVLG